MFDKIGWTRFLLQHGVLKFGEYTLKDGSSSPFFLDFGAICTGRAFRELGINFCQRIDETVGFEGVNFLYGPPYKASVIAATTAMGLTTKEMPCLFTRKESKGHGEGGHSFGYQPKPGESYLLLDDVMTSGATKVEALKMLPDLVCRAVVVGVDRQHRSTGPTASEQFTQETGVPVIALVTLEELVSTVGEFIPETQFRALREFCKN